MIAVLWLAFAAPLAAAQNEQVPRRPKLDAGADTNSAQAYFLYGREHLASRSRDAADAFYWASRLAPPWADPYYGRAVALILSDRVRLLRFLRGDPSIRRSPEALVVDSLIKEAYARNPLLISRLDLTVFEEAMNQIAPGEPTGALRRTGDPAFDAYLAYLQGRYADAARLYATALRRTPKDVALRLGRARSFAAVAAFDSTLVDLHRALAMMREQREARLEHSYETVAMLEYTIAEVHVQRGEIALAREAYERALTSDLAFYRAHGARGELAMSEGDTATATREFAQAVTLQPNDASLRLGYALALVQAGRQAEAATELERVIALEPWFAQPYYIMARLLDRAGFADDALTRYDAYLARAAQDLPEREWVAQRVTQMRAAP